MLRLTRAQASNVVPTSRLYEISSQSAVDVPVPRDADFREDALWLGAVPIDSTVRTTLRVYQPDALSLSVRVSVYSCCNVTAALASTTLILEESTNCAIPAAATATLQDLFPAVSLQNSQVNLKIEPLAPVARFWAFASATNNSTNLTHFVSPN